MSSSEDTVVSEAIATPVVADAAADVATARASTSTAQAAPDTAGAGPKPTCTTGSTAAATAADKSHTFRKRRLTFPTHHLDAAAAVAVDTLDDSLEVEGMGASGAEATILNVATDCSDYNSPLRDECEKSKTFRKRRLTLTKHQVQTAMAAEASSGTSSTTAEAAAQVAAADDDASEEPADYKKRRMSEMSHSSNMSTSTAESRFGSKIHHAGEILRIPPASPDSACQKSHLYAPPHNLEQYDVYQQGSTASSSNQQASLPSTLAKKQPAWRRRMTRQHSEDERKLPFPRDIVGQYSCHGIEPVYDSDYEHDPEEEEDKEAEDDDDDWLNEIPRDDTDQNEDTADANDTNRVANANDGGKNLGNHQIEREQPKPKVTTSAKINQDRGGIAFPYGITKKTALFAVYDGHGQGGELVSQYALHHVQQKLRKHADYHGDIEKAFKETFVTVDEELKDEPTIEPLYAGTTACVALLRDNKIIVSNAGDSRAVVARLRKDNSGWDTIQLSEDQNPDNPDEQERIEYCGGYVSPPPEPGLSARVWLDSDCTQIGLAMSRSIGDHAVKPAGVIAEPVVTQHVIMPNDDFLILASDGVWEFISSEEAVEIVSSNLSKGASKACQVLIEAAANKWHQEEGDYRDDITALVIRLRTIWDHLITS